MTKRRGDKPRCVITDGLHSYKKAINKEFKKGEVIVKLNFPIATYVPNSKKATSQYINEITQTLNNGIAVIITHNYYSKKGLLNWVASCDLMMYHYHRDMAGLCATTDQAISAETPVSVSSCNTFRHMHPYTSHYPVVDLRTSMSRTSDVKRMKQEWCEDNFRSKFYEVLYNLGLKE